MSRVLVTPRSLTTDPGDLLKRLEEAGYELIFSPAGRKPSEPELIRLVPGCVGWIAGVEPISARVVDAADRLQVISRNGTGVDAIDLAAAERCGISVLTAAGANAAAVADLALAFILIGFRHIAESASALKAGKRRRVEGRELGHARVGIIGCGAVGRRLASAVTGLGASVLGYDIEPDRNYKPAGDFAWASLEDLLAKSDAISLHCPAQPGGAPIFDRDRLNSIKWGAGIVNTARASLVDDVALLAALEENRIGWFATDVIVSEPPSLLLAHERVIATPHIGAFTAESGRAAVGVAIDNLLAALAAASPERQVAIEGAAR